RGRVCHRPTDRGSAARRGPIGRRSRHTSVRAATLSEITSVVACPAAVRLATLIVFDTTDAGTPADAKFCERIAAHAPPVTPRWMSRFASITLALAALDCILMATRTDLQQCASACYSLSSPLSSLTMSEVTRILSAIEQGPPSAAEQLLPLVYDDLRKLAA